MLTSQGVFYQTFTEELTPILLKIYLKIPKKGTFLNSFYESSITLIPILDKKKKERKKVQANITDKQIQTSSTEY